MNNSPHTQTDSASVVSNVSTPSTTNPDQLPRPVALPVIKDNVPELLKGHAHWVLWKYDYKPGKKKPWTKPPFQPNGRCASSTDPKTWSSFETITEAYEAGGFDGIGFVLTTELGFVGVDIDNAIQESGQRNETALEDLEDFDSYTEISPSGKGFRILCRGSLEKGRKVGDFEIYSDGRYLTITGHRIESCSAEIEKRQTAVDNYYERRILAPKEQKKQAEKKPILLKTKRDFTDNEIYLRLSDAKNKEKFSAYWSGDNGENEGRRSENDMALCSQIGFYTQKEDQVDRLFRKSSRLRDKWDEIHSAEGETYGEFTVKKAIAGLTSVYGATSESPATEDFSEKQVDAKQSDLESKYPFTSLDELRNRPRPHWLIEGILIVGTVGVLSGDSQSFKTFSALSMAFSVATGLDWHGRRVEEGPVVYIAAEGGWTLRDRLEAWETHHGETVRENFYLLERPVAFGEEHIVREFTTVVREKTPKLVIIDTLSACFQGLKENASEDMATFVRHMKNVARETGATVVVIHHNNKSGDLRGAVALKNDADTHITFKRSTGESLTTQVECSKHRGTPFEKFALRGVEIDLAEPNEHGVSVTSLVLEVDDASSGGSYVKEEKEPRWTPVEKRFLEEFRLMCAEGGDGGTGVKIRSKDLWERLKKKEEYSPATFYRHLKKLSPKNYTGELIKEGEFYVKVPPAFWITPQGIVPFDMGEDSLLN